MKNQIKFQQIREFGDIFNATFEFLKDNFKPLFMAIITYVGPLIVIFSVLYGILATKYMGIGQTINSNFLNFNSGTDIAEYALYIFAVSILGIVLFTLLVGIVYSYIILYIKQGKGNFEQADIFNLALSKFWTIIGVNILTGLFVGIGVVFCILPGIYLGITMSFMLFIALYENKGIGDALNRTFKVAHAKWWWNFLVVVVFSITTSMIGSIINLPFTVFQGYFAFSGMSEDYMQILYILSLVFTYSISFLTYPITLTALAFQYFSIVEEMEQPELTNRIGQIGQENNPNISNNEPIVN